MANRIISIPRILVAGAASGVGKTTIATGIMAALGRRGLRVQGYKVGPDYIDPTYHTLATGVPSRNLDSWMLSSEAMLEVFARAAEKADIAVIEGVMGLFDGHGDAGGAGSSAEVAKTLQAPVVLILDVGKAAQSAGAMALGYRDFDPALTLVGVILNRTGSQRHFRLAKEAVEARTGLPVVGCLPKNKDLERPERHLGLVPTVEQEELDAFSAHLADQVASTVDLDLLLDLARSAQPLECQKTCLFAQNQEVDSVRVGVARDEAFSFYYQDNLDLLASHGAEIVYLSPLHDESLPSDLAGLYLGGGFPEVYAENLASNQRLLSDVRSAIENGLPTYAECGGLMYLCEGLVDFDGRTFELVGALPHWCEMKGQRAMVGYVTLQVTRHTILAEKGAVLRGHEFHWSQLKDGPPADAPYQVLSPISRPEGLARGNLLASYVHLHFGSEASLAGNFVAACREWRQSHAGAGVAVDSTGDIDASRLRPGVGVK